MSIRSHDRLKTDKGKVKDPKLPSATSSIRKTTAEGIPLSEDLKKCVEFHGHLCPGLAVGYKASKAGLEWLKENRAVDEEIIAIVETDACSSDAVQVLTGCTFGKGNFLYRDHGKLVFSFLSRQSGLGVRVGLKPKVLPPPSEKDRKLLNKIRNDEASEAEQQEFWQMHQSRSREILEREPEELFSIRPVNIQVPQKARIEPSEPCERCGEPTMISRLQTIKGCKICLDCLGTEEPGNKSG